MNHQTKTYNISGIDIEIVSSELDVEARTIKMETKYRIKIARGAETPHAGRYHYSIALAEPVIPEHLYAAMREAVIQHAKGLNPLPPSQN